MATVEVSHKAASVHTSSKIADSFVASFPGLPHITASVYTHGTSRQTELLEDIYRSLAEGFPGVHRFSAADSRTASSFDVNCTFHVG